VHRRIPRITAQRSVTLCVLCVMQAFMKSSMSCGSLEEMSLSKSGSSLPRLMSRYSNSIHSIQEQDSAVLAHGDTYIQVRNLTRLSTAAHDAHPMTWCCIQKLCSNSGGGGQSTYLLCGYGRPRHRSPDPPSLIVTSRASQDEANPTGSHSPLCDMLGSFSGRRGVGGHDQ
jgi:hypothetical protein